MHTYVVLILTCNTLDIIIACQNDLQHYIINYFDVIKQTKEL